ncbi:DUF397 domain-containing protein [Streptomyces sp. WMMB303]|uniref:DUF397 domain-containing protein n=1 Tax=Streptomyces sp. WMMB303 TaxID=3034154 RepID=UPI0023EE0D48|nr:DUF397 domain-containing protein [Streptomyces sp. WMMB303]MDF4250771.1 DUF397 domain-containing protein [Streptomyces sp. WMMB303]
MVDLSGARWRASSYSNKEGGDCVEVADGFPGIVPVRDSKDIDRAPLVFSAHTWAAFVMDLSSSGSSPRPGGSRLPRRPRPGS